MTTPLLTDYQAVWIISILFHLTQSVNTIYTQSQCKVITVCTPQLHIKHLFPLDNPFINRVYFTAAWMWGCLCVPSQNGRFAVCLQLQSQYSLVSSTVKRSGSHFGPVFFSVTPHSCLWDPSHNGCGQTGGKCVQLWLKCKAKLKTIESFFSSRIKKIHSHLNVEININLTFRCSYDTGMRSISLPTVWIYAAKFKMQIQNFGYKSGGKCQWKPWYPPH